MVEPVPKTGQTLVQPLGLPFSKMDSERVPNLESRGTYAPFEESFSVPQDLGDFSASGRGVGLSRGLSEPLIQRCFEREQ